MSMYNIREFLCENEGMPYLQHTRESMCNIKDCIERCFMCNIKECLYAKLNNVCMLCKRDYLCNITSMCNIMECLYTKQK